jgi:hypothetical protein
VSEISVLGALAEVASGAESLEAYERGTMEIVGQRVLVAVARQAAF